MRQVVGALVIQKLCVRLPVEPAGIKGTVSEANKAFSGGTATSKQRLTRSYRIKILEGFHNQRIAPSNLFVTQGMVKVIVYATLKPVEIDINEKRVSVRVRS